VGSVPKPALKQNLPGAMSDEAMVTTLQSAKIIGVRAGAEHRFSDRLAMLS
jgi:hypothetical protein